MPLFLKVEKNFMPTNFPLAPASKTVDGLVAVPMDIQQLQASIIFDGATQVTTVVASITFITGNY